MITEIGEAFVGDGPDAAHVNTVLGARGGPVEQAWVTALATPTAGHAPFVVTLQPNLAVKPATLFVNKATVRDERHASLTWGAAQAGVAAGVLDAVRAGVVREESVDDLVLLAAVWVDPAAIDAGAVFRNNREATAVALAAGRDRLPALRALTEAGAAYNAFYPGSDR